jgi:hypothetical protein
VIVAEQQGHRRLGQEEHPDRSRNDQGEHGAPPPGQPGQEGGPVTRRPPLGQVRRDHRHDRDGHDAVGHLHERVGVRVGGDGVGPRGRAGQKDDDEDRYLVGDHETEGPSAEPYDGAERRIAQVPVPPQAAQVGGAQTRDQRHALEDDAQ